MGIKTKQMKLKLFTLASMVAAGTVSQDKEIASSGGSDLEELKRQVYAELARRLDDETASPADNSLEQSENMPEERERRMVVAHRWPGEVPASPDTYATMPEKRQRTLFTAKLVKKLIAEGVLG